MRSPSLVGVITLCASAVLWARATSNESQGYRPQTPSETIEVTVQGCLTQGAAGASGGGSSTNWTNLDGPSFTLSQTRFESGGAEFDHLSGSASSTKRPTAFNLQRPTLSSLSLGDYHDQLVEVSGAISADTVSQAAGSTSAPANLLGPVITVTSVKTLARTCPALP